MPRYYDSHTHLDDPRFEEDLAQVIMRADDVGIWRMMVVGADWKSTQSTARVVEEYPEILRAAIGIHPHTAWEVFETHIAEGIQDLLHKKEEKQILAYGEIGLDYYYEHTEREVQKKAFRRQLEWAYEADLPIIIHNRDAHADCLEILRDAKKDGLLRNTLAGVFHCYSGSAEMVRDVRELGFIFGFDGPVTFKNAKKFSGVLEQVELHEILAETDCPYLTPVPHRGKRNEPSYLPYIVETLAELKGISPEDMAEQCTQNTLNVWGD